MGAADTKNQEKKIFIICPVRPPKTWFLKKWTKTQIAIRAYVEKLESEGYDVYWPLRDNPGQKTDKIGILICEYNREKMFWANEIHIWYDKNSVGSVFDIGMFFTFVRTNSFKKFVIINRKEIEPTPSKSFENVVLNLAKEFNNPLADGLKERWESRGK